MKGYVKGPFTQAIFVAQLSAIFCRAEAQVTQAHDVNMLFITDTVTQRAIYRIDLYPNYG